jgi:hypothetical protein
MRSRAFAGTLAILATLTILAAAPSKTKKTASKTVAATTTTQSPPPVVAPSSGGCLKPPKITTTLPADAASSDQLDFNCFAWQEFIALNWTASTTTAGQPDTSVGASQFGMPNDPAPKVWETYINPGDVFRANAQPPLPWGQGAGQLKKRAPKHLGMINKFDGSGVTLDLSEFTEAFTQSWLTAQNGLLTLYEVRLNQDEYNYINTNGLYNAQTQQTFVTTSGINLPAGQTKYGPVGAIEVKAAWIELDDPSLWPYFKTSQAYVTYPTNPSSPQLVTVGLVGLHIIHKTPSGQQFIWATFEHVNNAPSTTDISAGTLLDWYTYYNASCDPATDHYQCKPNAQPQPGTDPYNAPVQVLRLNPIDTSAGVNNVAGLNYYVWQQIAKVNPNSVYLNYQLVNVLWPSQNTAIPPGATTPLTQGNAQPSAAVEKVANTTLETYFQTTKTCLDCHVYAPIASVTTGNVVTIRSMRGPNAVVAGSSATYASDYSFLFKMAQSPPTTTIGPVKKKK